MEDLAMFHIALCDNDPTQLDQFTTSIQQLPQAAEPVQLQLYRQGPSLLEDYQQGLRYNLVILGSARETRNLIWLARQIRRLDSRVPIMLLSTTGHYSLEGYEIPLYRYYKEPFQPYLFWKDLQELMEQERLNQDHSFLFSNWQGLHRLSLEDILYFKSEGSRILVATEHESYIYRESIRTLEKQLERFLFQRIHRSYLVNLHWVKNIWGQELTLRNGKVLPLARHRSRELRERLLGMASRMHH